jgi:hypothetical protein|tara:strand:+ start:1341 stop:1568 length:228 start_codon:yes stop_codon:yes gene_type:complete
MTSVLLTKGDAYRWGYAASYDGGAKDANPFDKGEAENYYMWNHGWWDARRAEESRSKHWGQFGERWQDWSLSVRG